MSTRRDELIAIAADLFAEQGFAKVTVDDIGRAAGVSGPALYHHFEGKEAMLGEMLVGISEYLLDGGRRVVEAGAAAGADDVLERLIEFHAEFAVDDRSLITVHFRELLHAPPDDQARVRSLQTEYVDLWTTAMRHRFPELPRRACAGCGPRHVRTHQLDTPQRSPPAAAMLTLLTEMAESALLTTFRS